MNLAVSWLCFVAEIAVLLWLQLHYMLIDKRIISLPPSLSPSLLHFPPLPCFPFFCGGWWLWFVCFWVFLAALGPRQLLHKPSLVSGGYSLVKCLGFSCIGFFCCGARVLGHAGSVVAAHGLSCPLACGIFSDQKLNLYPFHWKEDSQPLEHEGSPPVIFYYGNFPFQR